MCVGTVGAFTDAALCLDEFGATATDEEDILNIFLSCGKMKQLL